MDLKKINRYFAFFVGFFILSFVACEATSSDLPNVDDCENYTYQDCNTTEPLEANLVINFSISSRNKSVVFEVYKGYVDDNNLYFRDTSWESSIEYSVPVNEYYSVMAIYHLDGKTIKVIDGGSIKTHSKKVCDSTCWSVKDLGLNAYIK